MATWCSEWSCRIGGGLVHHIVIIPSTLTLLPLQGAAVGRAQTILSSDWFCTRFSSFPHSPVFPATMGKRHFLSQFLSLVLEDQS